MTHNIAVIGGTGPQGRGLALRFALAGHTVLLGSRNAVRALECVTSIREIAGPDVHVEGTDNLDAASRADIILLAIPWDAHTDLVAELADVMTGKIVISCVNPLGFDAQGPFGLELDESAAQELQRSVPGARVVGAFHHVAAMSLWKHAGPLEHEDVLVCGDDVAAKHVVMDLATSVTGKPGIDVGALRLARQLEPWTAVMISVNKRYKIRSGLAISGVAS
ncbi:NADPH-dependent F420 reductase [Rhodococcus sp. ACPA1]|uniref:NADPH-dependent F420 reductase n=1 Tax=Rhodococcus sp. ACPA1 TaxID=2028572 RepID=UPI000BB10FAD|nr:NADPH-dependent F420 reductase [Rhodococcus sp. ACPA1]PBC47176.1 NADPH-dependent F420 reductase [Rhodococcus sp. ACPA1]